MPQKVLPYLFFFEVHISEFVDDSYDNGLVIEKLMIRYKIFNGSNVHIDTTPLSNENGLVIEGRFFNSNGSYRLDYTGEEVNCGQEGAIYIRIHNDSETELRFHYLNIGSGGSRLPGLCPNGLADQMLSIEPIILTKQ